MDARLPKLSTVAGALALLAGLFAAPAALAGPAVVVVAPVPRVEVRTVAPSPDYVWVDGHWENTWNGWAWRPGYWAYVAPRPAPPPPPPRTWVPGHWERHGHHSVWIEGHWY